MNLLHSDINRLQEQRRRDTFDEPAVSATDDQSKLNLVIAQNQAAIAHGWEELSRLTQVLETLTARAAAGSQKHPQPASTAGTLPNNSQLSSVAESKTEPVRAS